MAKAWYQYPRVDNFGSYPDPVGAYPKPDSNIQTPAGLPVTALASGTVSSVRKQPWGDQAWSITVRLDKPLNSVATHMAYNYVESPAVSQGQHVSAGTKLATSGSPYNVGVAFALCDTDVYGTSTSNEPFSGTYINPDLNPVPFLNSIVGNNNLGNSSDAQVTVQDFMDSVVDTLGGYNLSGNIWDDTVQIITGHTAADPDIYNFMVAWAQIEGGGVTNKATFNPLNTKQSAPGSTDAGNGIQAYPDAATGIKATIAALTNGLYGALVNALKTNDTLNLGFTKRSDGTHSMASNVASELMIWDFGKADLRSPTDEQYPLEIMQLAGISYASIQGGNVESSKTGQSQDAITAYGQKILGPDTTGLTAQGAQNNLLGGLDLSGINNFFSALQNFFSDPVRIVKILGGAALVIAGVTLLVKTLAPGLVMAGVAASATPSTKTSSSNSKTSEKSSSNSKESKEKSEKPEVKSERGKDTGD